MKCINCEKQAIIIVQPSISLKKGKAKSCFTIGLCEDHLKNQLTKKKYDADAVLEKLKKHFL